MGVYRYVHVGLRMCMHVGVCIDVYMGVHVGVGCAWRCIDVYMHRCACECTGAHGGALVCTGMCM